MVHGRYKVPKGVYSFITQVFGKMRIPTKESLENDAFESNLEEMRSKTLQSFSALPNKFERGNVKDCLQMRDEFKGVELGRMNRLERMSRELREVGRSRSFAGNTQANYPQHKESVPTMTDNITVKVAMLIKLGESTQKDIQAMQIDMHYLALSKMQKTIDAAALGEQEMKELAVILNRVSGIILTILNVGLIIYTGVTMFSPSK